MVETTEVVIVGAGPVGLMLAGELRLADVDVVVLEQLSGPTGESRGGGLHPYSLELLDMRGLLDQFEALGAAKNRKTHFATLAPVDYGVLESRHGYFLGVPQSETERILEEHAVTMGAKVWRGHRVAGFSQDDDGVTVTVSAGQDEYRIRAGYLVGCDGGGSLVRKQAGIPFPGTAATIGALMCEAELERPPANVNTSGAPRPVPASEGYTFGVRQMPWLEEGVYRITVANFNQSFPDRNAPVDLAEMRDTLRAAVGDDYGIHSPRWLSRFGDASRQAAEYRRGRILVAGDAAHVHWPGSGQGLGLGLEDAMNLGWKLAAQVRGWAPEGLLDSYHHERHPVGASILANTSAQLVLMDPRERYAPLRELFRRLLAIPEVNSHLAWAISGIGIRYDIAGPGHELLGGRVPDFDVLTGSGESRVAELLRRGRGVLLDLEGSGEWNLPPVGRLDTVAGTSPQARKSGVRAILVRPDGRVAWVAGADGKGRPEDLAEAVTTWFGVR